MFLCKLKPCPQSPFLNLFRLKKIVNDVWSVEALIYTIAAFNPLPDDKF